MAAKKAVADWISTYAQSLNLKFTNLTWPRTMMPGWHDVESSITWNNQIFTGRGTAKSEQGAFTKAFAEVIERIAVKETRSPHSSGFAVHTSIESARTGAKLELFERDAFLCHFLTNTPFKSLNANPETTPIVSMLSSLGVRCGLCQMIGVSGYSHVVFYAMGDKCKRPFGLLVSSASALWIDEAILNAAIQGVRSVVALVENERAKESLASARANTPEWHRLQGLDLEYGNWFEDTFLKGNESQRNEIKEPFIDVADIVPVSPFDELPVYIVKCASAGLQDIYFGQASAGDVNAARLSQFLGRPFRASDLGSRVHPLG